MAGTRGRILCKVTVESRVACHAFQVVVMHEEEEEHGQVLRVVFEVVEIEHREECKNSRAQSPLCITHFLETKAEGGVPF